MGWTVRFVALASLLGLPACLGAQPGGPAVGAAQGLDRLRPSFVENRGQHDPRARFSVDTEGLTAFFTDLGVRLSIADSRGTRQRYGVALDFLGSGRTVPRVLEGSSGVVSYLRGSPSEWVTGARTASRIVYEGLWPGIDLAAATTDDGLKYEFVVDPGADAGQIALRYRGADLRLTASGDLHIVTPAGVVVDEAPFAYQDAGGERVEVEAAYAVVGDRVGFRLGEHDPSLPLVVDPTLSYSGYIGGADSDYANGVAVDAAGNAYVVGTTTSAADTFPAVVGPDVTYAGPAGYPDAFIVKVSPSGALLYAGYIGGTETDEGNAVAVDGSGAAYVTGRTLSGPANGFPLLVGPDLLHAGGSDAFVTKVNPAGTGLVFSGYIGGSSSDTGSAIRVGPGGAAYLAGTTTSDAATFMPVAGPDLSENGLDDGWVAKVTPDGSSFAYKGFIGGTADDRLFGIAVDGSGSAYVAGDTASTTFPATVGPDLSYANPAGAEGEGVVAKVAPDGTSLLYSGFVGGSQDETAYAIDVDATGAAVLGGITGSPDFPLVSAMDPAYGGKPADGFLSRVRPDGSGFSTSTFVGGPGLEIVSALALDASGAIHASLLTFGHVQPAQGGPGFSFVSFYDGFVLKTDPGASRVIWSTYHGGGGVDLLAGIAVDPAGAVVVAGYTSSEPSSFPVVGGPDGSLGGDLDAFVSRFVVTERCGGRVPTHFGSLGDDLIVGTAGQDVVFAMAGKDTVRGLAGADHVCGGDDDDRLVGGPGRDRLRGEEGEDRLLGGGARDLLHGGSQVDVCNGGAARDRARACEVTRRT